MSLARLLESRGGQGGRASRDPGGGREGGAEESGRAVHGCGGVCVEDGGRELEGLEDRSVALQWLG